MVSKRKSLSESEAGPSKKKVKNVDKANLEDESSKPKKKLKKHTADDSEDAKSQIDMDITIVKEELPNDNERRENNVISETNHINADLSPWPEKHMEELLKRIETKLPKIETLTYKSRVERIEWNDIAFGPYSGAECRVMWEGIQKRVRRYRILKELVDDAKEWVSKPWTNYYRGNKTNRHPDLPRRPLSTYMIFYLKKKDKVLKEHPGMDMTELSKRIAEMYKQLNVKSKLKYKEMAAIQRREYEEKMKEFTRLHPELVRTKLKKEKQTRPTLYNNAPSKPLTPFKLFCQDKLKRVEHDPNFDKTTFVDKCKEQWRTMSDKKKVFWINWSLDKESKYHEEIKKYVSENPEFIPAAYKSVVTKEERAIKERMAGKPEKPPNSAYSLFSRLMLVSEDVKKVNPKERMLVIAQQWKNCTDTEKKEYGDRVKHMLEQYKLQYAEYLESLPEEERQLELLNSQPKRKKATTKTKPNANDKESEDKTDEPKVKKTANSVPPKKKKKVKELKKLKPISDVNLYEGEPPPPPATPFLLFLQTYKKHYPHRKDGARQWSHMPEDQKDLHRQVLTDMKRIYIESYENFLKSLTQEQLKEYSEWKKQNQNLLSDSKRDDDDDDDDDDDNKSDKDDDDEDDDDNNSDENESDTDKEIKEESQDDPDSDSDSSD